MMLTLRRIRDEDRRLVERWLRTDHVKRWYEIPALGVTIDDWLLEIDRRHGEYRWLTHLIALWQGRPFGLCQYYRWVDSDEDVGALLREGSYGIDYLIGDTAFLGRGFGTALIRVLVHEIFSLPDAERITADIDADNTASGKALVSCGFSLMDSERCRYVLPKDRYGKPGAVNE